MAAWLARLAEATADRGFRQGRLDVHPFDKRCALKVCQVQIGKPSVASPNDCPDRIDDEDPCHLTPDCS
ncbi:hypothetical protein BKP42_53380 [Rhodococcus erythropolis]|nr:hypothetical protein [Rhodococcus erythropolis]PBI91919.1 hypothetical protein BKP42_53380 [Rhodococcus erythropolis]